MGRIIVFFVFLFSSAAVSMAADGGAKVLFVEANRTESGPVIDGRLDDSAWQAAIWSTDFRQSEPDFDQIATEKTEVAFLFDDDNIYVAIRCFDSEPDKIVATRLRHRDNPRRDDYVAVIFDTYRDQVRGTIFVVNPLGAKDEGQVNGFRRYNWDWDEVWDVAASYTGDGWQAEFRIPLRVLRFSGEKVQVWGVNVRRMIRRKREDVYLVPPPPPYDISSLNYAAKLRGMEHIRPERNLQVKPYVLAGAVHDGEQGATSSLRNIGLDVKYSLTSDLTLDVTVNTDFAQVESDDEQVNLTRFSLFYPEKREFFLENAQLFSFGSGGRRREMEGFFSRKIGLYDEETVPINLGARLTGKVGGQDIGILSINTAAVADLDLDQGYYNVVRIRRNLVGRSYLGALFTDSRRGDFSSTSLGFDGEWFLTSDLSVSGYFLSLSSPEIDEGRLAWETEIDYTTDLWGFRIAHREVGENFDPDLGYVRRENYRSNNFSLRRAIRPGRWGVRRFSLMGWTNWYTTMQGPLESLSSGAWLEVEFESGEEIQLRVQRNFERLFEPFDLGDELIFGEGDYRFITANLRFETEESRRWRFSTSADFGQYFDGNRRQFRGSFGYVINHHLNVRGEFGTYHVDSPSGVIDWQLWSGRIVYSFNANLSTSAFIQYNSSSGDATFNLRLRWLHRNDSDFFIVFNERRSRDLDRWILDGRDTLVKANYRFFF